VHGYAQTNLQLYAQLQTAGWDEDSIALLGRAYELALSTCGTLVRPNGKPFLCHLVGTASIVSSWRAPGEEVVCGLVHSVYTHGVFADVRPGPSDGKRAQVRTAIGEACEALVYSYTQLTWNAATVAERVDRVESLTRAERSAVRVRLANELEDHLDLGVRYARKSKALDEDDGVLLLAERLVGAAFAGELAAALAANASAVVPDVLIRDRESSFAVP
jgi:(p)ppGpp synthase/HD superfamily hydrolase